MRKLTKEEVMKMNSEEISKYQESENMNFDNFSKVFGSVCVIGGYMYAVMKLGKVAFNAGCNSRKEFLDQQSR